jgi:hypothetical protein
MAVFVHFTDENNKSSIMKNGLKIENIHYEDIKTGLFCMPVISDFYATHQWVREIRQYYSGNNIVAVYFKIPDDEIIFCGKYNEKRVKAKSTEAHKIFISLEDKMGFQAIIPRKVKRNEITRIKNIPQITGWRYFPKSHEKKRCLCPDFLTKGSYNSNNIKKSRLKKLFKELSGASDEEASKEILSQINDLGNDLGTKGNREIDEKLVKKLSESNDDKIKSLIRETIDKRACLVRVRGAWPSPDAP